MRERELAEIAARREARAAKRAAWALLDYAEAIRASAEARSALARARAEESGMADLFEAEPCGS